MTNYKLHEDCKILAQNVYPNYQQKYLNGWTYKDTYSNHLNGFYSEVYMKGNKVILAIRGTELNSGLKESSKDIINDFQMNLNCLPWQMESAEKVYLQIIRKFGKENVILTGHSLGGSEAQILGAMYGAETITFGTYGTRYLYGVQINHTNNITNYGNAQDPIFVSNIDAQIGKTVILNTNVKSKNVTRGHKDDISFELNSNLFNPHYIQNFGDLSQGVEYKQEIFENDKLPVYKLGIEYNDYNPDEVFTTKNRVLYRGEINIKDLEEGSELFDLFIDNFIDKNPMPTKKELDKRTRIGELIYIEEYVRSDGTKVSGYYRTYPKR